MYVKGTLLKGINIDIACVASASVWFRSNERPRRNGISGFGRAKNGTRASPLFYSRHFFRAVFDSRSSLFAPKPHGNVYYAS